MIWLYWLSVLYGKDETFMAKWLQNWERAGRGNVCHCAQHMVMSRRGLWLCKVTPPCTHTRQTHLSLSTFVWACNTHTHTQRQAQQKSTDIFCFTFLFFGIQDQTHDLVLRRQVLMLMSWISTDFNGAFFLLWFLYHHCYEKDYIISYKQWLKY